MQLLANRMAAILEPIIDPNRPNIIDIQRAIPLYIQYFNIFSIEEALNESIVGMCQYLNAVGYRSTVAVFRTFEPIPLATRSVSNDVCNHGMSTNTQAIPQAPVPAKIETEKRIK